MDAELKQRWLDAMSSGKYKWGKGSFYDEKTGCHCALGVLLDIEGLEPSSADGFELRTKLGISSDLYDVNDGSPTKSYAEVIEYVKEHC